MRACGYRAKYVRKNSLAEGRVVLARAKVIKGQGHKKSVSAGVYDM